MLEFHTESSRRAVSWARHFAFDSTEVTVDHLLQGLAIEAPFLIAAGLPAVSRPSTTDAVGGELPLAEQVQRILAHASDESARFNHPRVGCLHVVLGILHENKSKASDLLAKHGVTTESVNAKLAAA